MNFSLFFDRSFTDKVSRQLGWLIVATIVCLALLICASYAVNENANIAQRLLEIVNIFVDTGSVWKAKDGELLFPHIFVLVTTTLGITLLSGVFVSIVTNMLSRREAHYLSGDTVYTLKKHYVILGYNEMTKSLVKQIYHTEKEERGGAPTILLVTSQDVQSVRFAIKAELTAEYDCIILKHGRRDNLKDIEKLKIEKAKRIYILGENGEVDHDSITIKTIDIVANILKQRKRKHKMPCYAVFDHNASYVAFQTTQLDSAWKDTLSFKPINIYEEWAKKVFLANDMRPVYSELNKRSLKRIHLVIYGMNRTGVALGLEAGQICHFPNFRKGTETIVTFVDENAEIEMNYFKNRMRHYFEIMSTTMLDAKTGECLHYSPTKFSGKDSEFLDVKYEFVKGSAEMPEVQKLLTQWNADPDEITILAICYNDQTKALTSAIYLPDELYRSNTKILVYQKSSCDLVNAICLSNKYKNIKPFGMIDEWMNEKQLNTIGGKMVNAIYSDDEGDIDALWERTPLVNQWSSLYCADHILVNIASMNITAERLSAKQKRELSEVEHNRWNMEKLIMGFRKAGPGEPNDKNTFLVHNDIKPFDQLSEDKKDIDEKIIIQVREIAKAMGVDSHNS